MARPKSGRNGKSKKFYLNPVLVRKADKLAFQRGMSLSKMVGILLAQEIATDGQKKEAA